MRIRATVAAVSGALALSAFVVPAAQAADGGSSYRADVAKVLSSHAASGKTAFSAASDPIGDLDVSFSDFKITKAVKVGTTAHVSTSVTYTLTHGADVDITSDDFATGPLVYRGSSTAPDNVLGGNLPATCTATSATTATCKGLIDVYPSGTDSSELKNSQAGTWHGAALALDFKIEKSSVQFDLGTTLVQRNSTLTVNAAPEPVRKGKTLTVTGKLARANWETHKYAGYTGQPVQLQFRKKGSSTYTTLKTVKSDSTGNLKTTTTATADGYYRFSFAGTSTTPAVNATGDFVDVQ
ncbi:hypothetical protein AQI88_39345 [Streptomyces cellostaticus]|uniref:Calcium-binding protein n=1 Tax=Streptomyces cellostaticus TaxID=67285 RepID=A0A101NB13_9ACTN|nr:hypothetical protein [Streptomyces cellostaticus]KUM89876.1 hypothetical protein AQI88_39345 [Streptomyces cellostaticus]GHI06865.1 hypothetical protein Scel_51860 [Streptomyces cellostaticus]